MHETFNETCHQNPVANILFQKSPKQKAATNIKHECIHNQINLNFGIIYTESLPVSIN